MDSALLSVGLGSVGTTAIMFLTSWENDRRRRREEERKAVADDRAALETALDEFVAAALAVRVEGNAHDHLWGGWRARSVVALHALAQGGSAYVGLGAVGAGRKGAAGLLAAYGAASNVIDRWNRESAVSAVRLSAPLARLGAALPPLLRHPDLAEAAQEAFNAISAHTDTDRTDRAFSALYDAFAALSAPTAPRRRFLRRRTGRTAEGTALTALPDAQ
ncbi:hypothetical protein ACSCBZ_46830 [Streptomyces niveiscabiei]|uniref:hypothetical protein n=1 Tax=Streptomyces niveiscabiei TaxID=164115 RepID=UPI0006EBB8F5|nr:hypothetical protein [Streptomyces niveiscabiei]